MASLPCLRIAFSPGSPTFDKSTNFLLNALICALFGPHFFQAVPRFTSIDLFAGPGLWNLVTCHSPHRRLIRPQPPVPPVGLVLSLVRIRSAKPHHQIIISSPRRCLGGSYRIDTLRFHSRRLNSHAFDLYYLVVFDFRHDQYRTVHPVLSRRETRNTYYKHPQPLRVSDIRLSRTHSRRLAISLNSHRSTYAIVFLRDRRYPRRG